MDNFGSESAPDLSSAPDIHGDIKKCRQVKDDNNIKFKTRK